MSFPQRTILLLVASIFLLGFSTGLQADTFEVDGAHSSVVFRIKHTGLNYVYGMFSDISGHFAVDESGSFDITVGVDSIDSGNDGRDRHLRSPDFFNSRQFPTISFESEQIKKVDENTVQITGKLTMMGQTSTVTTQATTATGTGQGGESKGGLVTSFDVKRSDFELGGPGGISDEVTVTVSLQGSKQ